MQQQISIDIQPTQSHPQPVLLTSPQPQEELISQHYQEDFDSIQDEPPPGEVEIEEDLNESGDQPFQLLPQDHDETQSNVSELRLKSEIIQLQHEISNLEKKIEVTRHQDNQSIQIDKQEAQEDLEQLIALKENNERILISHEEDCRAVIGNVIGKEAVSIDLILQEQNSGKMIQEYLLQQAVRVNALLHCTGVEIGKLKREIKQNGDTLANIENIKNELRNKHISLFREIEEKKQKSEKSEDKITALDLKIAELKDKIAELVLESKNGGLLSPDSLTSKWQQLMKQKLRQQKKNILLQKSNQHALAEVNKSISQMQKQVNEITSQIDLFEKKSLRVQSQSEILLGEFNKDKEVKSKRYKKTNSNHFITQKQIPSYSSQPHYFIDRKRNFSIQNKVHPSSQSQTKGVIASMRPLSRDMTTPSEGEEELLTQIENKLKECSTDGSLRKQFKLKLPSTSLKKSKKYLDLSGSYEPKEGTYAKTMQKKSQLSKLSITQRLQRIQLLERQDRLYSHKLYSSKPQTLDRQNKKISDDPLGANYFTTNQQASLSKQIKIQINNNPNATEDKSRKTEKEATQTLKLSYNSEVDNDKLPTIAPKQPTVSFQDFKRSNGKKEKMNQVFKQTPNIEGICPKNLFSSIQQKLTLRESEARQTFNLSHFDKQQNISQMQQVTDVPFLTNSRLSRQSSIVRRRGQKKISDEYMKILEERGRRILQLDYQGD